MKAAVVRAPGQTPVYADFPDPLAREGERRIEVRASALSQLARARASGAHYTSESLYPFIAGVDGVGHLEDGERVYFLLPTAPLGAMAERTSVPDNHWIAVPDQLDDLAAAVIANPGMSSWAALVERARLTRGERVLINGATGASGRLAVRIARHLGASKIVATGRNQTMLDALGADAIIPLKQDEREVEQAFLDAFAGGIDVVLDYLWGPSARTLLLACATASKPQLPVRFVQIGSVTGSEIALPASVLRSSGIEMMGSGFGSVSVERLLKSIDGLFGAAVTHSLALDYRAIPLADVEAAWSMACDERIVFTNN